VKQPARNNSLVSRSIGPLVLSGVFFLAGGLFAGPSAIEGVVKDPNGRPISGADVRLEAKSSNWNRLVRSDANGRYSYDGLTPNVTYRVILLINGAAIASINNVVAKVGTTKLNFDLRTSSVSGNRVVTKNGKHYVYIPGETGSHLGGRWVEVDENGQADSVGVNNVERANSEALRRMQSNSGAVGGTIGGH
jgi:Carboxypeptidase regulatory-like domain